MAFGIKPDHARCRIGRAVKVHFTDILFIHRQAVIITCEFKEHFAKWFANPGRTTPRCLSKKVLQEKQGEIFYIEPCQFGHNVCMVGQFVQFR